MLGLSNDKEITKWHIEYLFLDKTCVNALNYLINNVSSVFDTTLVLTSARNVDMPLTLEVLKDNDVLLNKVKIDAIRKIPFDKHRGQLVKEYLTQNPYTNFVVIDDEWFDYREHIYSKNIIKTNYHSKDNGMGLTTKHIYKFLNNHNNFGIRNEPSNT